VSNAAAGVEGVSTLFGVRLSTLVLTAMST